MLGKYPNIRVIGNVEDEDNLIAGRQHSNEMNRFCIDFFLILILEWATSSNWKMWMKMLLGNNLNETILVS